MKRKSPAKNDRDLVRKSSKSVIKPHITNNFTLFQVKKMIGKKLLIPWNGLVLSLHEKNNAKLIKDKILEITTKKNLVITTICIQGILHVIRNLEVYLALHSLSYKEIEKSKCNDINVIIIQYPKMTKAEILEFIKSS